MKHRSKLGVAALSVAIALLAGGPLQAAEVIKIGAVAPKTGPLAGGSALGVSCFSAVSLSIGRLFYGDHFFCYVFARS